MAKRTLKLSAAERARRSRQARINFGKNVKNRRSTGSRKATRSTRGQTPRPINKTMAKKRRSTQKKGFAAGLGKPLTAGITYAFVQPFVSQFLKRFQTGDGFLSGTSDEFIQIGVALLAKQFIRSPIVKNYADAALIINIASLTSNFAGKILPVSGSSVPLTQSQNNGMVVIG